MTQTDAVTGDAGTTHGRVPPFNADDLVVVTGAAGFIGSNVAERLAATGARVVAVDRLGTDEKWRNLRGLFLHDVLQPEALAAFLSAHSDKVPAIIHMGAVSATTERDVDRILRDNVRTTLDLWTHTRRTGTRFIYASSAATYGDGGGGFVDCEDQAALLALAPLNAYGWSKVVADLRICRDAREGRAGSAQWAGLRFFNVYGPREDHKGDMRSVVNKIMPRILAGESVELFRSHRHDYEDGGQLRDFVHVRDCVTMIEWLLSRPDVSGLLNVGSGEARSFRDLALATYAALERQPDIRYIDMPVAIRDRYQYFTEADMSKARGLGFAAAPTRLEHGIAAYAQWWSCNR